MDVYVGQGLLDSSADAQIRLTCIFGMDTSLHTDLGPSAFPCLLRTSDNFIQCKIVGGPTQIFAQLPLGKGTELAAEVADVGVVDVPVDGIRNNISIDLLA